jgi:hypothetical protein
MAGVVASTAGNETSIKSSVWAAEMVRLITLTRDWRWLQLMVTNGTFPAFRLALEFAHGHYREEQVSMYAVRNERG